jgi:hypothetical protein
MEIKEFEKYARNLGEFSAADVKDFTTMTNAELDEYQDELEQDTGNLSDWDHIRAFITMKIMLAEALEAVECLRGN